jgi:hypothetical protein
MSSHKSDSIFNSPTLNAHLPTEESNQNDTLQTLLHFVDTFDDERSQSQNSKSYIDSLHALRSGKRLQRVMHSLIPQQFKAPEFDSTAMMRLHNLRHSCAICLAPIAIQSTSNSLTNDDQNTKQSMQTPDKQSALDFSDYLPLQDVEAGAEPSDDLMRRLLKLLLLCAINSSSCASRVINECMNWNDEQQFHVMQCVAQLSSQLNLSQAQFASEDDSTATPTTLTQHASPFMNALNQLHSRNWSQTYCTRMSQIV